jgi:hypothetical protein
LQQNQEHTNEYNNKNNKTKRGAKEQKISATKTKEARGVNKQRNKNSKTRRGKRCQQAKEQKEGTKV